jgi:hypothetical protein
MTHELRERISAIHLQLEELAQQPELTRRERAALSQAVHVLLVLSAEADASAHPRPVLETPTMPASPRARRAL